jgi:hypothetical protein
MYLLRTAEGVAWPQAHKARHVAAYPLTFTTVLALFREPQNKRCLKGNSLDNHQHSSAVSLPRSYNRLFEAFDMAWPTLTRVIADRGLTDDTARRKLADAVLLFAEGNRSAAEIAEAALEKLGV